MESQREKKSMARLSPVGRRAVDLSQAQPVRWEPLDPGRRLPLLVQPAMDGVNLTSWLAANRAVAEQKLLENGGLLFRGFDVRSEQDFEGLIRAVSGELIDYTFRSTPRTRVSGNIFTSTEYPADQQIPLHNEMSYTTNWPMKIWFFCMIPADRGGETPIADSFRVYERIDPAIRERFATQGVLYTRNYGNRLDLSWENVFQTSDRAEVERFCSAEGIRCEWKDGNRLRTSQVCQGVARHPVKGEPVWFNQAHLFHVSALPQPMREALLDNFDEADLPRNAYYGDGTPIENEVLDEIRRCYEAETVVFPWQKGDVLFLDNMAVAHGRRPFSGQRRTLAGMAEPCKGDKKG